MKKFILAVAAWLGLALTQTAPAQTITVANFNDSGAGSLRAACASPGANVTIIVPAGTYNLTSGELAVAPNGGQSFNIQSSGGIAVINQTDGSNRVFNIDANSAGGATVSITGLTIQGGHDANDNFGGAGILAGSVSSTPKDVLNLTNCFLLDNHSKFVNSSYTSQPGGGVQMAGGDLNINHCVFSNNTSQASQGGAIELLTQTPVSSNLRVLNSSFFNNGLTNTSGSGPDGGGAINIASTPDSRHVILGSTFANNTAATTGSGNTFGGAISINTGVLNVTNSVFTGNSAPGTGSLGGAIYVDSGTLNMSFCRLTGNTANAGGNAVYNHGSNGANTFAANNWWGLNLGPGASGAASNGVPLVTSPFIILTNTPNVNPITLSQSTTFTASFLQNSAGTTFTPAQIPALIGLPVTWNNAVLGSLSSPQTTIQANGTATALFTAGLSTGTGHADATVDGATATGSVTISCPTITAAVSGGAAFCVGGSGVIQVDVTGGLPPYTVTLNNGGGTQTGNTPLFFTNSPAATTVYQVASGSDSIGCPVSGSGSATNTVYPTPSAAIAASPTGVCTGSAGNTASGQANLNSYSWTIGNGTITSATNLQSVTYTAGSSGNVTLNLTVFSTNGCGASASTNVIINPLPATPTIYTAANVCAGSAGNPASVNPLPPSAVNAVNSPKSVGTYAWTISNGTITSATNLPTITYTAGSSGMVTLTVTVINFAGCSAGSSKIISLDPHPTAVVSGDGTILSGGTALLTAALTGTPPWLVTWSDGFTQTTNASPALHYVSPTNTPPAPQSYVYTVTALSDAYCTAGSADLTGAGTVVVYTAPYAATVPATLVTGTGAQLNGFATPNGLPASAWFQWGTDATYGNLTAPVSVGSGSSVVFVTNGISGLTPGRTYHFRLVVSNALAMVTGYDQEFSEGGVIGWGDNADGETTVPVGLNNVVAIAGGAAHSLALKSDGTVAAWGDNSYFQTNLPVGLSNVVAIAGGAYHSLALKSDGTVAAWGNNNEGETSVPADLSNVVAIAGGYYHSLALKSDGTLTVWGNNNEGETNVPAGLNNVVAIAGGGAHSLALKSDGTVTAWGRNLESQTNVPVGLNTVVAIAGGGAHSLALKSDGTVAAWGYNGYGQTNIPVGLSNVAAIAGGSFHTLALRSDGTVAAWGSNLAGQTNIPAGLNNVVAIAGGASFSLALTVNTPPVFTATPSNQIIMASVKLVVTNNATELLSPPQTLTYSLQNPPPGATIDTNGVITWTPDGTFIGITTNLTTIVTDNGTPNLSATNVFAVTVICPDITATVSGGASFCPGGAGVVRVDVTGGYTPYTVSLSNGGGTQTGSSPLFFTNYSASTTVYEIASGSDQYGCGITAGGSATNTVYPLPPTPVILTPDGVCAGSSGNSASAFASAPTVLSPNGNPFTYAWNISNGTITSATNLPAITYTAGASGTVTLSVTRFNAFACGTSASTNVTINPVPPTPTLAMLPSGLCGLAGKSTGNLASGPADATAYAWTIANGTITSATNLQTITFSAGASGTVTLNLVVFNSSGCSAGVSTNAPIYVDNIAPVISCPSSRLVIVPAGTAGTNITYAVSATDNCDPNPILTVTPPSGVAFPPGSTTVHITAADHVGNTNTCSFIVRVHALPTVTLVNPTNSSVFVTPQNIFLLANAADADVPIANVGFYQSTNLLGVATGGYFYNWTNIPPGSYPFSAVAADTLGLTATSAVVNISMLAHIPIAFVSTPVTNVPHQFSQTVHIVNPTPLVMNAIRLSISNAPPRMRLMNVAGTNNGLPYLMHNQPVPPGGAVDFSVVLIGDAARVNLSYIADLIPVVQSPAPGANLAFAWTAPQTGAPVVTFMSLTNRIYFLQYSSDLLTWITTLPTLTGTGGILQWADNGPPQTVSAPGSVPQRFYRVLLAP